ncbi:uncharacterized protein LOC122840141 isoform X2 [Gambusia affinis]|uniref:uncharacterized protein LOC122840141 isoform X2 n=1 Tax=Gambusia affinis TaxID=33528 RepID=UPI001CDCA442|nr:uncharacterized protein LOC122840141 isoform X2 [Gambusia affinis]
MSVGKAGSNQGLEGSVICLECRRTFPSFVNFELKTDGRLDFQMELFEDNKEESPFVIQRFAYKQQDDLKQRCTVKCPYCLMTFELTIHLTRTIEESQFKIKLSVTTCGGEKEEKGKTPRGLALPALRRVKVSFKCSGETFRGDDQVKEQLDKQQTLHVQETNLKDSDVVIVFCPITSRVGSDVESTMRDEMVSSLNKPIILVLMHHTRDFEYSTAGTIWSEVYPNVVLDVHVLFHETKPGLLKCRQNEEAFEIIKKELNKHSKPAIGMLTHHQPR